MEQYTQIKKQQGFSLVEILVGMGILAIIATSTIMLTVGSFNLNEKSNETLKTMAYSKEAIAGIEAIASSDWRYLITHSDSASYGLSNSNGYWEFVNSDDTYENFSREVRVIDVYRDQISGEIVDQTTRNSILDPNTKTLQITTRWQGIEKTTERLITNWQSQDWTQANWSGGSSQLVFTDPTMYYSDDGKIDTTPQGKIRLKRNKGKLASHGELISSAYKTPPNTILQFVDWTNINPKRHCTSCSIKIQLRTAPDVSDSPGTWTNWFGANGEDTYFTRGGAEIVPFDIIQNQWVQYKIILEGDGTATPILLNIEINYK